MTKVNVMAKAKTENMQPPAFLQRLLDGVKDIEDKEVSVNVKSKKFKPEQSFVMVFTGVALQLFEKLTFNDFKVLMGYSHLMSYGNQISISQQDVSNLIGIARPNVARSLKKLKELGVVYSPASAPNSLYVHPAYIAKGDLHQFKKQLEDFEKMVAADQQMIKEEAALGASSACPPEPAGGQAEE